MDIWATSGILARQLTGCRIQLLVVPHHGVPGEPFIDRYTPAPSVLSCNTVTPPNACRLGRADAACQAAAASTRPFCDCFGDRAMLAFSTRKCRHLCPGVHSAPRWKEGGGE